MATVLRSKDTALFDDEVEAARTYIAEVKELCRRGGPDDVEWTSVVDGLAQAFTVVIKSWQEEMKR